MGQLERYGLYVLVVVIFLILGVAIWGGDPVEAGRGVSDPLQADPHTARQLPERAPAAGFFEVRPPRVLPSAPRSVPAGSEEVAGPRSPSQAPAVSTAAPARSEPALSGLARALPELRRGKSKTPQEGVPAQALERPVAARRTYRVRPGDTIESIARRELGSVRYVRAILDLNRSVDPRRMREGTLLVLPEPQSAPRPQDRPSGTPARVTGGRTYRFRKGDSLWTVSRRLYGSAKYVRAIMEANGIEDPRRIRPGTVLRIPDPR